MERDEIDDEGKYYDMGVGILRENWEGNWSYVIFLKIYRESGQAILIWPKIHEANLQFVEGSTDHKKSSWI